MHVHGTFHQKRLTPESISINSGIHSVPRRARRKRLKQLAFKNEDPTLSACKGFGLCWGIGLYLPPEEIPGAVRKLALQNVSIRLKTTQTRDYDEGM